MKKRALLFIILIATSATAQEKWNVQKCIEYAVAHNHQIRRQQLTLDNYEASKQSAIGNFLPAIDANIGAQYNFGRAIDPETNTYTNVSTFYNGYSLYASLPVFDGLSRIHALKAAKADVLMGKNALKQQQDQTALATFQAFINVLYYQGMVKMAAEKISESELMVHQTQMMYEVGQKSQADVAQMEAQQADAIYQLTTYQNQLSSAFLTLKQEMNYPLDEELTVDEQELRSPYDSFLSGETSVTTSKLLETPELQKQYFAKQSAYYQWKHARADFYPSLSFSTGMSTTYYKTLNSTTSIPFNQQFHNNMGEYVSATLSIPIFNRLRTISQVRKAKNNYLIAREAYEEKCTEINKLAMEAWQDMHAYIKQTMQAEKKVEADSLAYQLTRRQYEEGLCTAIDVHNTSSAWLASQSTLLQCQLMVVLKEYLVSYYKGEKLY